MLRHSIIALLTAASVLALANLLVFTYTHGDDTPATKSRSITARQRWLKLSPEERLRLLQRYREVVSREDAREVLNQARQFAQLAPARQALLRRLYSMLANAPGQQTAPGRSDLLRYPPSARAYWVYQSLASDDPQELARLAHELRAASEP